MNPELVDAGRQVDSLSAVFSRFRGNRRPENLQPGIENCRVNLKAMKLCLRPIGHLHFTQHIAVVPPQLSDALKERTVVDAAFAESPVIILAGDLLGASSLHLRERLLPGSRGDAAVVRLKTDLAGRMQHPRFIGVHRAARATVDVKGCRSVRARGEDHLNRVGSALGQEKRLAKFDILQRNGCAPKTSTAAARAIST